MSTCLKAAFFAAVWRIKNALFPVLSIFDRLHMLKSLDVSFNFIETIPEEIGSVASLVK